MAEELAQGYGYKHEDGLEDCHLGAIDVSGNGWGSCERWNWALDEQIIKKRGKIWENFE